MAGVRSPPNIEICIHFHGKTESEFTFNELSDCYLDLKSIQKLKYDSTIIFNPNSFNDIFGDTLVGDLIPEDLLYFLQKILRAIHEDHVFMYRGKPIKDIRAGLKKGCAGAGIPYGRKERNGFTFHDLRHSFNTNMRKADIPESVIMTITGHNARTIFDRYNTIDEPDIQEGVGKMAAFLEKCCQNAAKSE